MHRRVDVRDVVVAFGVAVNVHLVVFPVVCYLKDHLILPQCDQDRFLIPQHMSEPNDLDLRDIELDVTFLLHPPDHRVLCRNLEFIARQPGPLLSGFIVSNRLPVC
jgi:hypothetical protein